MKKLPFRKVFMEALKIFLCLFALNVLIFGAGGYLLGLTDGAKDDVYVSIVYFLLFVAVPIVVLILFRKNREIRVQLSISVIVLVFVSISLYVIDASSESFVKYDFELYLSDNTEFEKNAATVMPSKLFLENTQVTYYEHRKGDDEMLRLSVRYDEKDFLIAKSQAEEQYLSSHEKERSAFYLDGELYFCYVFYRDGDYYAMAYHVCTDTKTISYMLYQCNDFSSMATNDVIKIYFGDNRVTAVS